MPRFDVDDEGYKKHMQESKPFRVVQEIISNSFDEDSVNTIILTVEMQTANPHLCSVLVHDNGKGFRDIKDAYTMYKHSYKRADRKKIGKFNLGEKQFFVLAEYGYVKTKNQMVEFIGHERKESPIDYPEGTEVYGTFKWTNKDVSDILTIMHKLIVPQGKKLFVNQVEVKPLVLVKEIPNVNLWTEFENKDTQVMQRLKASTTIELYQMKEGEKPWLYNLGIPVQKIKTSIVWHINVKQKIPLGINRDVVSESYLQDLYTEILNHAPELVNNENAGNHWVQTAMKKAEPEVARKVLVEQFGTDKVIFQSNDHNANEQAIEAGFTLIQQGIYDRDTRKQLVENGLVQYSSEVFQTDLTTSKPFLATDKMKFFVQVMELVARDTVNRKINFYFVSAPEATINAQYSMGMIAFNVSRCGKSFFNEFTPENVGLTIHELAHVKEHSSEVSHLTMDFVHEVQRIAGILACHGIQRWIDEARRNGVNE